MAKIQQIKLKSGAWVMADWDSRTKCKSCGAEIFWAKTNKGGNMPIELVGLAEWDSHYATCPQANKWRKKKDDSP